VKTKQKLLIICSAIILTAIITNPNQAAHKEKVKSTITAYYQEQLTKDKTTTDNGFKALGSIIGNSFINSIVETAVSSDNYFLFSVTKINYEGQEKTIGYGVFGNVFLFSKIEKAFNK